MDFELNKVYKMDNLEGMRGIPDGFFDIGIVDPPYGLGIDGQKEQKQNRNPKHNRKGHAKQGWDNAIPGPEYFAELFRVTKNQIIWGANYFVEHLAKGTKGWVVWYKGQEGLTMSDAELAYSSFDSPTRVVKINRVELLKENSIHPTQKPVKLYKWLLKEYAQPGQTILDTHVGSGSSRIACHDMGHPFLGFEISPKHFADQELRFADHIRKPQLFTFDGKPLTENQTTLF